MPKLMIAKNRKGNNMSNGLLAMYIFLAVFATGLVIYSNWEDKHRKYSFTFAPGITKAKVG